VLVLPEARDTDPEVAAPEAEDTETNPDAMTPLPD
jgi:hypothetical protein